MASALNKKIIPAAVAVFVLLWCAGCEKSPLPEDGTVDVALNIGVSSGTLGLSKASGDGSAEPYEGIRTLRVLVISEAAVPSDRKVLYNVKHTVDGSTAPSSATLSARLTLHDVPVGRANIYIIANEESLGMTYDNETLVSPDYFDDDKLLLLDEGWNHFPKRYEDIAAHGLPMSGRTAVITIEPGMSGVNIQLYRAVVKLHLTVENSTTEELRLEWVKFGKFISDRVYMFRQMELDIPDSTQYKELRYPENEEETFEDVTLASTERTDWNSVYIYPNYAYKSQTDSNPYTLSLATEKKEYEPSLLADNMNSMPRNSQYNITARINASATISIRYQKVDWTAVTVNVPPFD